MVCAAASLHDQLLEIIMIGELCWFGLVLALLAARDNTNSSASEAEESFATPEISRNSLQEIRDLSTSFTMGKKNKKNRRYDDDDILGGPSPDTEKEICHDVNDIDADGADADGIVDNTGMSMSSQTDFDADAPIEAKTEATQKKEPTNKELLEAEDADDMADTDMSSQTDAPPTQAKTKTKQKKETTNKGGMNVDLALLEEAMTDIIRNYPDKPDDWLLRSTEKNMHIPKNTLRNTLESYILEEMMERIHAKLDNEYEEEMDKMKNYEALVAELSTRTVELTEFDKVHLREEADAAGVDPDEAVELVTKAILFRLEKSNANVSRSSGASSGKEGGGDSEMQMDSTNTSISVSILLTFQPYLMQSTPQHSSFGKLFLILRQYICIVLYTILGLILGETAKDQSTKRWETIQLPLIKAQQLAKEKEEDKVMLGKNTHLWSTQGECWIEKDHTYTPPSDGDTSYNAPPTIRWNAKQKRWERWSKNLTTRTKASKQAAASGGASSAFTKGTFVIVKVGEGWATTPDQPEVDNKQLDTAGIRFFVCLPSVEGNKGEQIVVEVVDVTNWATKSLLSKEAARELGSVDSGKELFTMDASTLLKGKKGSKKGSKNPKTDQDDDAVVARKGVGYTTKVSKKYAEIFASKSEE